LHIRRNPYCRAPRRGLTPHYPKKVIAICDVTHKSASETGSEAASETASKRESLAQTLA